MPPQAARSTPTHHLRLVAPGSTGERAPRPTADEDLELLAAFQAGRPGAGAALYDRLLPVVDATVFRILGRREHDHADLVQSAFEQIVSTLTKRRYERGCSLTGWAAVLACHVGLNALRSRRRERAVLDRDHDPASGVEPPAADPEDRLKARDQLAEVRKLFGTMHPDRVTALLLHASGYDLREIAALTRTSVAAAQSRLSRARRELRSRIEQGAIGRLAEPNDLEGAAP